MNEDTKQFINDHLTDDVHQLSLQIQRFPTIDMSLVIRQITGKQKVKHKIPLFFRNDELLYPAQLSIEQSSSELTARYKSSLCEGETLVDLTGGFGIDCCFMSNRFKKVLYIERQAELCELARHNFKILCLNNIQVINSETEEIIFELEPVDWIYIDPARRNKVGNKVVSLSDCEPDVSKLSKILLQKAKNVMIKLSPMMDISTAINEIPQTKEIHIISIDNECKENILILKDNLQEQQIVKTININKNTNNQLFEFNLLEEKNAIVEYCTHLENYLYEPNAAIMKSGAFKLIAERFKIKKLHKHTHLYTSNELINDFPGRIFNIIKIWENSKIETKRVTKANISTRNYPLNAENLRNKLKIKTGGDIFLFACTLHTEKKIIIECTKAL